MNSLSVFEKKKLYNNNDFGILTICCNVKITSETYNNNVVYTRILNIRDILTG